MAPLYFKKILPFVAKRYTLTNRRLMIQRGLKPRPRQQVALADIDDVRLVDNSYNSFYRAGDLEVIGGGQVKLKLTGVPAPESFRRSILNALAPGCPARLTCCRWCRHPRRQRALLPSNLSQGSGVRGQGSGKTEEASVFLLP